MESKDLVPVMESVWFVPERQKYLKVLSFKVSEDASG